MLHHIVNFILGSLATAGTAAAITNINHCSINVVEGLLKYFISILGGILATIIINILKNKFPDLFGKNQKS
jgi:hypothetical protein